MTGRELTAAEAVEIVSEMVSGGSAGLEGGAELEVFDEAGQSVCVAPLARHVRLDEEGIIWVRPIVGGYRLESKVEPAFVFDLSVARRRALDTLEIRHEADGIIFWLRSGERARITPVSPRTKTDLELWDRFFYNAMDSDEQLEMDSLMDDS